MSGSGFGAVERWQVCGLEGGLLSLSACNAFPNLQLKTAILFWSCFRVKNSGRDLWGNSLLSLSYECVWKSLGYESKMGHPRGWSSAGAVAWTPHMVSPAWCHRVLDFSTWGWSPLMEPPKTPGGSCRAFLTWLREPCATAPFSDPTSPWDSPIELAELLKAVAEGGGTLGAAAAPRVWLQSHLRVWRLGSGYFCSNSSRNCGAVLILECRLFIHRNSKWP